MEHETEITEDRRDSDLSYDIETAIFVGTGGVFYYSVGALAHHFLQFTDNKSMLDVLFIDPDRIEERNAQRQPWAAMQNCFQGTEKVTVARQLFKELAGSMILNYPKTFMGKIACAYELVNLWLNRMYNNYSAVQKESSNRIWVFALPDSNLCRGACAAACCTLSSKYAADTVFVSAGNTLDSGQAWAYRFFAKNAGDFQLFDRLKERHDELWDPDQDTDDTPSCSEVPTQSAFGNMMTVQCIAKVLEDLREHPNLCVSEWYWNNFGRKNSFKMWKEL